MPTKTFLNLHKEKQDVLLKAAFEEFKLHPLSDASINKIIQEAHIPRGSFYQYFDNIDDLYFYLFEQEKRIVLEKAKKEIQKAKDIKEMILILYDTLYSYILKTKKQSYYKNVMITFHKAETKNHKNYLFLDQEIMDTLEEKIPLPEDLRKSILEILFFLLTKAIIDSLEKEEKAEEYRKKLEDILNLIYFQNPKEEN